MNLNQSPQIRKLAQDLGLRPREDVVAQIVGYCDKKIQSHLKDFPDCETLSDLLDLLSNKLMTTFENPRTNTDLKQVTDKYLSKGQKIFSRLGDELSDEVYGVTFKLLHREDWETQFVSVVDSRGEKESRCYFTKWHEIAHLLTLTDQMRLSFRRTHCVSTLKDPEEALMDIIAGNFGFYPKIIRKHINDRKSFEEIKKLRNKLYPDASNQSSIIGFVEAWPKPCLLLTARLGLRKHEQEMERQKSFTFHDHPKPSLRAVQISRNNEGAKRKDLFIFKNMRIPEKSVIYKVFSENLGSGEAEEDLSWWESSNGNKLQRLPIRVIAKHIGDEVQAIVTPLA